MWYHDASFSPSVDRHPGSPESCPNKRDLHIKISESGEEIRTRPLTRTSARWHNGCGVGEQYVWFYVVELSETSTVSLETSSVFPFYSLLFHMPAGPTIHQHDPRHEAHVADILQGRLQSSVLDRSPHADAFKAFRVQRPPDSQHFKVQSTRTSDGRRAGHTDSFSP